MASQPAIRRVLYLRTVATDPVILLDSLVADANIANFIANALVAGMGVLQETILTVQNGVPVYGSGVYIEMILTSAQDTSFVNYLPTLQTEFSRSSQFITYSQSITFGY